MTPAMLLLYAISLPYGTLADTSTSLHRKAIHMTVSLGSDVTLQCPHEPHIYKYFWYKQRLGEVPTLVSNIYLGANNGVLENEFKTDPRFKLGIDKDKNHLNISSVQLSDSATYFCTRSSSMKFEFARSITVFVKDAEAVVQQSVLEDAGPGRTVALNCRIHVGSCDGKHRVHWFRQSEESAAGVLYSHGGGSSDQCQRNPDAPTNSCVYSLNVSSEQTGTYYCAVAACGQVLFGNGTRLSVQAGSEAVYVLSGALVLTSSLLLGVTFCLCLKHPAESHRRTPASFTKGFPKVIQYTAAEQMSGETGRRMDETWSECIYFSVDQ